MTTLKDIATAAGVKQSTVSVVLNGKQRAIRISDETSRRIRQVARKLNYQPNAAAKALVTKRTGRLGFILSDDVTDGWANTYYGQYLAGVEDACRQSGYGLAISRYNISNVDTFAYPRQVGQRSVDGLILSGYIEHAVLIRFREFGIPCVCLGEDLERAEDVPALAADATRGMGDLIAYALDMGHRRIGLCVGNTRDAHVKRQMAIRIVNEGRTEAWKPVVMEPPGVPSDFSMGRPLLEQWLAMPASERPSVIISNDQTCLGFLQAMGRAGMSCPRDVSLISGCDTRLCEFANPAMTALRMDMKQLGAAAVKLLIDHLDHGKPLTRHGVSNLVPCEVVCRESVARLAAGVRGQ